MGKLYAYLIILFFYSKIEKQGWLQVVYLGKCK